MYGYPFQAEINCIANLNGKYKKKKLGYGWWLRLVEPVLAELGRLETVFNTTIQEELAKLTDNHSQLARHISLADQRAIEKVIYLTKFCII